jgi:predicted secreted protein
MGLRNAVMLAMLLAPGLAAAQAPAPELKGSRVTLDARASMEVDNDVMRAMLFVEAEDADATKLAEKVNRAVNDSINLAKGFTGLRARTSGYTTYPVSDKGKIVRWRSRSQIVVEGDDFRRTAEAIGKLQSIMQLGSVDFSISPAARAKADEALTQGAIAEFLRKADLVAKGFKGAGFSVLEASVATDGGAMPPPRPWMSMKAPAAEGPVTPEVQGGTTRITVTVSGAILIPR